MTFKDVLKTVEPMVVQALQKRAAISNRMAKAAAREKDRRRLYQQKDAALSGLIVLRAARVVEPLSVNGQLTLSLPNRRHQHMPTQRLTPEARRVLRLTISERLLDD